MNYHNIKHDDMLNGEGIRVTLFVSGCTHHCNECQNMETWDYNSGILFNDAAKEEIFNELSKDYIAGLTLTGGDPFADGNVGEIYNFLNEIKNKFPKKNIWIYTGYTIEEIMKSHDTMNDILRKNIVDSNCDVLCDGRYDKNLADKELHWVGSSNQKVIYSKDFYKYHI